MGLFSNADGKVVIVTQLNTNDFEKGLSKIQSTTQKAGNTIKSIIVGLGITKLVSMAMNQITGSIDDAITRIDTLNQFPKVMSNLGISAEESQEAIDKMADKLAGLPTTLDQAARAVQRFTSKNGNVKKSTDLFLALNNAILAGGASSEIQASALEQLSQAYAKGKPDMMEWRTAMTAMPAQLKQVAKAMGYIDADQLGEALRDGTVSMDEFMETIERLNTEGIDGFQSFEKQARNSTGGIKTSIDVAKTQVVKGVADIINALNTKMEESGMGSISDFISKIGENAKKSLDTVAKLISGEISPEEFGQKAVQLINLFIDKITEELPKVAEQGIKIVSELIKGISSEIPNLMEKAKDLILAIPNTIYNNIDTIVDAGLELALKLAEGFEKSYPALVDGISLLMDKMFEKLEDEEFQAKLIEYGARICGSIVVGLLKALPSITKNTYKIPVEIIKIFMSIPDGIAKAGKDAIEKFADGMSNKFESLPDKIYNWGKNAVQKLIDAIKEVFQEGKELINKAPYYIGEKIGEMIASVLNFGYELKDFVTTTIPQFINDMVEWFKQLPEKIKNIAIELYNNFINQMKLMPEKAKEVASELYNKIVNTIKGLPDKMYNIGKDIVKGIWNGIKNLKGWLVDKTKEFAQGIVDGIKSKLKIHSPSQVFRDEVGKQMVAGIGIGFEDGIKNVYRNMQHAIDIEQSKLQASVETGKVFNTLSNTTPVAISVNADVEMDSQKVGRLVTPTVTRTIKNGGGV